MKANLIEMEGFLRGKCLPGDMLVNETNAQYLVRKFAEAEAKCAALAAENAGLKSALNPEAIPDAAVEAFTETAIMGHDWNETGEWSWVENDTDVIRAVLEAIKPETPATDAYRDKLRAQGVDAAIEHLTKKFEGTGHIGVPVMALEWLAQEIRKGGAA